jgi:hypothetical protein
MSQLMPPPPTSPPGVALADDNRLPILSRRLRMVSLSLITILVTTWFFTLGIVPGVLAAMVAKHILVAILTMGLGVDKERP